MAAMIIYTVVIKEGALPKLREIVLIVAFGCKLDSFRGSSADARLHLCPSMRSHLSFLRHHPTPKLNLEISQIIFNPPRPPHLDFPPRKGNHQRIEIHLERRRTEPRLGIQNSEIRFSRSET
jgi:hypothetical protein